GSSTQTAVPLKRLRALSTTATASTTTAAAGPTELGHEGILGIGGGFIRADFTGDDLHVFRDVGGRDFGIRPIGRAQCDPDRLGRVPVLDINGAATPNPAFRMFGRG